MSAVRIGANQGRKKMKSNYVYVTPRPTERRKWVVGMKPFFRAGKDIAVLTVHHKPVCNHPNQFTVAEQFKTIGRIFLN